MKRLIVLIYCMLILTGCNHKTLEDVSNENKYELSEITSQYSSVDGLKKAYVVSNLDFHTEVLNFTDSNKIDEYLSSLKKNLNLKNDGRFYISQNKNISYLILIHGKNLGFSKVSENKIKNAKEILKIVTNTQ